ncbi:Cytoskeleton-associated protein 2, partial [Clarias magur]
MRKTAEKAEQLRDARHVEDLELRRIWQPEAVDVQERMLMRTDDECESEQERKTKDPAADLRTSSLVSIKSTHSSVSSVLSLSLLTACPSLLLQ